jgi:uncharacterized protein
MSTREDYPAGVPCWVDTNQPDPVSAAQFYSGLFGWQTEDAMPPDAGSHYYMARIGGRDCDLLAASRGSTAESVEYVHPRRVH